VYGPLEKVCGECKAPFVFGARAQQHMYEVLRLHVDATAKRCQGCARKRRALEDARAAYAAALKAAEGATTAKPHLDVAKATLDLVMAGGRAGIDRAIGACRRARRLGAGKSAARLEAKLITRRAG
jgi:hypothetical protein